MLSRPTRSGGDQTGAEAIGGLQRTWRTLNTWLFFGTSAGTFECSVGRTEVIELKQVRKTN